MDYLIENTTIVTMDKDYGVIQNGYLGIEKDSVAYIGACKPNEPAKVVINGKNRVVLPGFHNTHTHAPMSLLRGYADDYNLQDWLHKKVFPIEAKLCDEDVYLGTLLAIADCVRQGTVSIKDMYFKTLQVGKAAAETGILANISNGATGLLSSDYSFSDTPEAKEMEEFLKTYHGYDDGRLRLEVGVHAEYTSFSKLWRDSSDFALRHGLNTHAHISETQAEHNHCVKKYGLTPTECLNQAGFFENRSTAAHCVATTKSDRAILKDKNVTVAHNVLSNLKLGSGVAPVADMLKQGVRVALGTDGVCSNNSHDMFDEMKMAALVQKGVRHNPKLIDSNMALEMATVNGAYAQGRDRESGVIRLGYSADITMVDVGTVQLFPVHNPVSTLVYSASGRDVCMTMVRGKILYENGNFTTIDVERLFYQIKALQGRLFN